MTFDENACIRYLMKEMDPSEELLFEKKMMEDENLLIEVESLRKVNQRLSGIPEMEPPKGVTEHHIKGFRLSSNKKNLNRGLYIFLQQQRLWLFSVAGAFWIYENSASAGDSHTSQANSWICSNPVPD
jgi:hypothetical protein